MYSTNLRDVKAFVAEQKNWELKKTLLRSKRMEKFKGKRIKPNELIKKQRSIYITQDLQNMDTHPNKLKNRP